MDLKHLAFYEEQTVPGGSGAPWVRRNQVLHARPPAGTKIGWGLSKLTRGLVFGVHYVGVSSIGAGASPDGYAALPQDIVSPRADAYQVTGSGQSGWGGGPIGVGYESRRQGKRVGWKQPGSPDTAGIGGTRLDKINFDWTDDLSIFLLATVTGGAGNNRQMGAGSGGPFGHAWGFGLNTLNVLTWSMAEGFGPSESVTGATSVSADAARLRSFGVSRHKRAGTMSAYLDGREDGVSTSLLTGTVFTLGNMNLDWEGLVYLLLIWRGRALTERDMMSLHVNPWQMFMPLPLRFKGGDARLLPSGIESSEAVPSTHHVGDITLEGIESAEGVGSPTVFAGDISPSSIASTESISINHELIAEGSILLPEVDPIESEEAFGTPTLTADNMIFPTGIPSGFDMDLHVLGAPVGTFAPYGIASEEGFGTPTLFTLANPPNPSGGVSVSGTRLSILARLCAAVELRRAEDFVNAPEPANILPDVYGDFAEGGLRGPCPTVLISQTSPFIYLAANHPVKSIEAVYVDDVEQTSGFSVSVSYPPPTLVAGVSPAYTQIAVIVFTEQPTGVVTWRGKGRMEDDGTLIVNPIRQLEILLRHRCGFTNSDFDAGSIAEAISDAAAVGYELAWVFNDDRQIQEWITEVLFNVMGYWRVNGREELQIGIDPGGPPDASRVAHAIIASRDVVHGEEGVEIVLDRQNLVNKLNAYYLWSWSTGQPSSRIISIEDNISINAHGEQRKAVTLKGHRDQTQVHAWGDILMDRQSFRTRLEGGMVRFTVRDAQGVHLSVGDLISFSWASGPIRELGNPYVNQILRVISSTNDWMQGGMTTIEALDTGEYMRDGSDLRILTPGAAG